MSKPEYKKIAMNFSPAGLKVWEAILRAKAEVDSWPAWKRGEAPVPAAFIADVAE